jgi:hypothetical protein
MLSSELVDPPGPALGDFARSGAGMAVVMQQVAVPTELGPDRERRSVVEFVELVVVDRSLEARSGHR